MDDSFLTGSTQDARSGQSLLSPPGQQQDGRTHRYPPGCNTAEGEPTEILCAFVKGNTAVPKKLLVPLFKKNCPFLYRKPGFHPKLQI